MVEHMEDDMTYKRVTEADRRHIYRWCQERNGLRELARRLGGRRAAWRFSTTQEAEVSVQKQAHEKKAQTRALRPGITAVHG